MRYYDFVSYKQETMYDRFLQSQKTIWNFRQVIPLPQNSSIVDHSQINPINSSKAIFQVNIKNTYKKRSLLYIGEQKSKEPINLNNVPNTSPTNPENKTNRGLIIINLALAKSTPVNIINILQITTGNLENLQKLSVWGKSNVMYTWKTD